MKIHDTSVDKAGYTMEQIICMQLFVRSKAKSKTLVCISLNILFSKMLKQQRPQMVNQSSDS